MATKEALRILIAYLIPIWLFLFFFFCMTCNVIAIGCIVDWKENPLMMISINHVLAMLSSSGRKRETAQEPTGRQQASA